MNQPVASASLFTFGQFGTQTLISLLLRAIPLSTVLFLVYMLGRTPELEAFLSVFTVASALMLFHTAVGYPYLLRQSTKAGFELERHVNELIGSSLVIAIIMTLVILVFVTPINVILTAGKPTVAMQDSIPWLGVLLIQSLGSAPLRGALNLRGYVILPLTLQVSTFGYVALGSLIFPDFVGQHITQTYVMMIFVEVGITYGLVRSRLKLNPSIKLTYPQLKQQFKATQWLLIGFALQSILAAIDIPTAALAGEGAVTIFQSVFRVPYLMMWSVSGVVAGLIGAAVSKRQDKVITAEELQATLKTALKLSCYASIVSMLITSFLIYKGLAGALSMNLFVIAIISAFMIPCWTVTSILSKFLDIWDMQRYSPAIYVAVLIVRSSLAYPLIFSFGLIGVAGTLLVGQLTLFLAHWFVLREHLPKIRFAILK